jgi:hypothetical protein
MVLPISWCWTTSSSSRNKFSDESGMNAQALVDKAKMLVTDNKGLLAMKEKGGT